MRVCSSPGCPNLTPEAGRCQACRPAAERARGTRQARGYDAAYDRRRRADIAALSSGAVLTCWRCGGTVLPHEYSLGHCDQDRATIHGPEHLSCNLRNAHNTVCPHSSHAAGM